MKKIVSALSLMGCLVLTAPGNANAQAVEQGNMLLSAQYGYPNLFNLVLKAAYETSGYNGLEIGGIGPVGAQFEYMVADKIGFGLKFNYTSSHVGYTENTVVYDQNGNPTTSMYDYKLKFNRIRVMPRFALHFGNSSNFDGYFGVSAGYSSFKVSYESNDPDYDGDIAISNPIPVGFRLDVGGNYFFTDFLGINFELGIGGGPILNAGLTFKL